MLPNKTFICQDIHLQESDFDANSQLKHSRVLQLMQNLATEHAEILGFGWNKMNENGLVWVLGKIKVNYFNGISKPIKHFKLYTWPIAPSKFFADRLFVAVDECGKQLFCAVQTWLIIDRQSRHIASSKKVEAIYRADFDETAIDCDMTVGKIRVDDEFSFSYSRTIRFCDLDLNGHVNNTCYIDFAIDTQQSAELCGFELTYNKELLLNDTVLMVTKKSCEGVLIAGLRDQETCFTCRLIEKNSF